MELSISSVVVEGVYTPGAFNTCIEVESGFIAKAFLPTSRFSTAAFPAVLSTRSVYSWSQ